MEMPALYKCADKASNAQQRLFLHLVRGEFALLVLASILSMNFIISPTYYIVSTCVLLASLTVLLVRTTAAPQQDWYKCRALSESVKTIAWRYAMRADPFKGPDNSSAKAELRDVLLQTLDANEQIGHKIVGLDAGSPQATNDMEAIRASDLEARKSRYLRDRIQDQRAWYTEKACSNRKHRRRWISLSVTVYFSAIILSLIRIAHPDFRFLPIEPLLVLATTIIGWMQIRKFDDLSSAYSLTAHEIGIIETKIDEVTSEPQFSEFVNEAEQAFSREHTQWVARQVI